MKPGDIVSYNILNASRRWGPGKPTQRNRPRRRPPRRTRQLRPQRQLLDTTSTPHRTDRDDTRPARRMPRLQPPLTISPTPGPPRQQCGVGRGIFVFRVCGWWRRTRCARSWPAAVGIGLGAYSPFICLSAWPSLTDRDPSRSTHTRAGVRRPSDRFGPIQLAAARGPKPRLPPSRSPGLATPPCRSP
jgi:hypothetical protein